VLGAALYQASTTPPPTEFRTATTVVSAPVRGPQVRAVFASATTVEDLHRIARAAGVRIVDGPSEAGVYTLALDSTAPGSMDEALDRLRGDPRVRFAEPVSAGGSP
jgi:hypothetical protein